MRTQYNTQNQDVKKCVCIFVCVGMEVGLGCTDVHSARRGQKWALGSLKLRLK